jgi:hypothetical protein
MFPAKVSRHSSINGKGKTSLTTPACFVDEEEAHLQKMLDAGVIQPSISEWASAPVLIRKRESFTGSAVPVSMACSNSVKLPKSKSSWAKTSLYSDNNLFTSDFWCLSSPSVDNLSNSSMCFGIVVKQRMRRTPACFADEEEAHLQKMLDAGVIQPSISEWASAPVLIRKRDGGVRWCIVPDVSGQSIKSFFN